MRKPCHDERHFAAPARGTGARFFLAATALGLTVLGTSVQAEQVAAAPPPIPLPIPALDLPRYLGHWYEIARYPNRFQQRCASDAQADYRLQPDGEIRVLNRCRRADGTPEVAEGVARQLGGANSARLEVRFAPAWLSWVPVVWGDYWVIDLDPDYRLAAVSEHRREFLWILSRQPEVDPVEYAALLRRLTAMGFDLNRLQSSTQSAKTGAGEARSHPSTAQP